MNPLERRYRRLLLAYPRAYRRARGDELVTTLLEGAPPDRTHPPAGDAWDLVRGGLRQRFRPPHGRRYTALAVVGAAAIAWVAFSVAMRAVGEPGPGAVAVPAAMSLMPPDVNAGGRASRVWTSFGGPTRVEVTYAPGSRPLAELTADLRARAVAEGWTTVDADAGGLTLERGGETMVVTVSTGATEYGVSAFLDVRYPLPASLVPAGGAALVLGGLTGWLLTVWALRRFRTRAGDRAARKPSVDPVKVGTRVLATAHLAFGAAIATVFVTFAARMWATGASAADMVSGQHDPKEVLPFVVYAPVALLYYPGVLLSPLLLLVSVPLIGVGRARVSPLARRVLLIAAGSAVTLPALLLTPYGGDVARWWLD